MNSSGGITMWVVPSRQEPGHAIFSAVVPAKGVPACQGCHGSDAQGQATFPRLAGQHADYLVKQLILFQRNDERPEGGVMKVVVHELQRQNIGDDAIYLQSLSK